MRIGLHHVGLVGLLLFLGVAGTLAYWTNNPDSPSLAKVEQWPWVGPYATQFREAYQGPPPPVETAGENEAEPEPEEQILDLRTYRTEPIPRRRAVDTKNQDSNRRTSESPQEPITLPADASPIVIASEGELGTVPTAPSRSVTPPSQAAPPRPKDPARQPYTPADVQKELWLLPGTGLHARPDEGSAVQLRLDELTRVPILERRPGWSQIAYRRQRRWLSDAEIAPLKESLSARPKRLLRTKPNDASLLRKAKKLLGLSKPNGQLGPYRLFTDVEDQELLALMNEAATQVRHAYYRRYGRLPGSKARRAVVFFNNEEDYRAYSASSSSLPGFQSGHAGGGIAAFYKLGSRDQDTVSLLLHELTHLQNARSLTPWLPPWLEEGLASDLERFRLESPENFEVPRRWVIRGADQEILLLQRALEENRLPTLAELVGKDRETFLSDGGYQLNYPHSAAAVRYFLDGEDGALATGFRNFLRAVANGSNPDGRELVKHLKRDGLPLEMGFRSWLSQQKADLSPAG